MKLRVVSFIMLFLFLSVATAGGADIYVSAETGQSFRTADGSKGKPYKDLQAALDRSAAGDTLRVAAGNYLGTSNRGFLVMLTPVSLIGGYSTDFSFRDVLKNRTYIQPTPAQGNTASQQPLLRLGQDGKGAFTISAPGITIDGIIFDRGFSNGYHPTKGKPEGVETGMLLYPPATGMNRDQPKDVYTIVAPLLAFTTSSGPSGNLTIQNCVFANGGNHGIQGFWKAGKLTIRNNVFVAITYAAVDINGQTSGPTPHPNAYAASVDFSYNTVLFTWTRTADLGDMGYGYRYKTGINTDISNCLFGCTARAALERTRNDTNKSDAEKRRTGVENTAFFLNRMGDLETMAAGTSTIMIWAKNFEDREELYKYEGNRELPGDKLKGKINEAYLKGFLSMLYTEKTDYNPNSPANEFRRAFGMNQVATVTTKVDMFANRYPLEDALKLFGAVKGYGAQLPQ